MAIIKTPYEFLVRFNPDGTVRGSHIKWLETVDDGAGNVLMEREGDVEAVASAGSTGFPLSNILDAIQSGALAAVDAERANSASALAAKDAEMTSALAAKDAEKTAAIQAKDAEIAALKQLLPPIV